MTYPQLLDALEEITDPSALAYQKKVITDTSYPMCGIRMGVLRRLARQLSRENWEALAGTAQYKSYEEVLVIGLAIAYAPVPFLHKEPALMRLLPRLDSWAHTDSIAPTLKPIPEEKEYLRSFAVTCLQNRQEYTIRFGIVILLHCFLTPQELSWTASQLCSLQDDRYYVRMAAAWCMAEMAVVNCELVMDILRSRRLDTFTHNMTIQKMRDSFRISDAAKTEAASYRRKDTI